MQEQTSLFDFFNTESLTDDVLQPVAYEIPYNKYNLEDLIGCDYEENETEHTNNPLADLLGNTISEPLIDRERLAIALQNSLHNITLERLASILTNEFSEIIEYARLCREEDVCRRTSLLFNPHRLSVRCGDSISIFEALQDEKYFSAIARATLWREGKASDLLYQVLQSGFNWVQWCAEFAPIVAVNLCKCYNIHKDSKVLDPCAGWGGRMIGISVLCNNYTCYEPSTKTNEGLIMLRGFIRSIQPGFEALIIHKPYEDSKDLEGYYDFALTSPPYYDTEKYSDEETNSLNRYSSYEDWCDGFYIPMIDKTMRQLKRDAVFVFNIADRRYPLSESLRNHCKDRYKLTELGYLLGYNSGQGRSGEKGEKFYEISHL